MVRRPHRKYRSQSKAERDIKRAIRRKRRDRGIVCVTDNADVNASPSQPPAPSNFGETLHVVGKCDILSVAVGRCRSRNRVSARPRCRSSERKAHCRPRAGRTSKSWPLEPQWPLPKLGALEYAGRGQQPRTGAHLNERQAIGGSHVDRHLEGKMPRAVAERVGEEVEERECWYVPVCSQHEYGTYLTLDAGRPSCDVGSPGIIKSQSPQPAEKCFPIVWEHGVLPFLIEFMPRWADPGHVISVMRGKKPGTRRISIMTKGLSIERQDIITKHARPAARILPADCHLRLSRRQGPSAAGQRVQQRQPGRGVRSTEPLHIR